MKKTMKRLFILGAALTFLGGQSAFATDPVQEKTQVEKQAQTTVKECTHSKAKTAEQKQEQKQTQTGSEKTGQSGK